MSEIDSAQIRRGFWIDWSKGHASGATITTTTGSGNVVIALLAVLVSLATDHLWNLALFAVHQSRASRATGDAIFQQQQVLIRTLPTPFLFLIDIVKVAWTWRRSRGTIKKHRWSIGLALIILTFSVATLAASIFSSFIVKTSNVQVLVSADGCFLDYDFSTPETPIPDWYSQSLSMAQKYVDSCYSDQGITGCNIFVQPRVSFDLQNSSCPLVDETFCTGNDPASLVIDSGFIDSNDILGINDKPSNRIKFRRKTTYFPTRIQNQFTMVNATQLAPFLRGRAPLPGEQGFSLNYGYTNAYNLPPSLNTTAFYPSFASNSTKTYMFTTVTNYSTASPGLQGFEFQLIPELYSADADTTLVFMFSNIIESPCEIEDPVFTSHKVRCCQDQSITGQLSCVDEYVPTETDCSYHADYPTGVLAAQQQYQICLADDSGNHSECTDLIRAHASDIDDLSLKANEAQRATLNFLTSVLFMFDLNVFPWTDRIAASKSLSNGRQICLPRTQWMTEAYNLESTVWALMQLATAYRAGGPFPSGLDQGFSKPNTTIQTQLCESQKVVKPGGFANINVLGLSLVVGLSGLIIMTDIFLLKIFVFMGHNHPSLAPRVHRWVQDGVLQLQRRAYEADGIGPWTHIKENEVPILVDKAQDLPTFFSACEDTSSGEVSMASPDTYNDKASVTVAIRPWRRKRASETSPVQPFSPMTNSSAAPLTFSNNVHGQHGSDDDGSWNERDASLAFSDSLDGR